MICINHINSSHFSPGPFECTDIDEFVESAGDEPEAEADEGLAESVGAEELIKPKKKKKKRGKCRKGRGCAERQRQKLEWKFQSKENENN